MKYIVILSRIMIISYRDIQAVPRHFSIKFPESLIFVWVPHSFNKDGAAKPKAIVMMLIDDLGFWDTAVQNPLAPTPHLGQMKSEGIVLDQMYVPALSHLARSTDV